MILRALAAGKSDKEEHFRQRVSSSVTRNTSQDPNHQQVGIAFLGHMSNATWRPTDWPLKMIDSVETGKRSHSSVSSSIAGGVLFGDGA